MDNPYDVGPKRLFAVEWTHPSRAPRPDPGNRETASSNTVRSDGVAVTL